MSFLKELEAKKKTLKKTCLPDPQREFETMIVEDESDYNRLIKETYFEEYYSSIEEFTFKSVITPLTLEEINDLKKSYTAFMADDQIRIDLSSIEAKIEDGISEIRRKTGSNCQVFVRLSSRSPKDAIYHLESFKNLYLTKLSEFSDQDDIIAKLFAFYKASTEIMAVSNGQEATDLLRRSDRIQGDLQHCLDIAEPMNLIIREFVSFPVKNEFRGFIYKEKLTALTQYNNLAYFPQHLEIKSEMERKIKEFVEGMKSVMENCILDLVIDDNGKVWVVEMNPFGELAGACLFSWSKDREILMGKKPFEFRIVEEKPTLEYIKSEIDPKVLKLINVE